MSTIFAELQLKTGAFTAAMGKVDKLVSGFGTRMLFLNQGFQGVHGIINSVAGVAGQLAGQMKRIFDLGGEISDVSANTGMAASEVMVLRQAFANAGMGAGDVTTSVALLQRALAGTNEEGQSTSAALQRLGLAAGQLDGLSAFEQIKRLQAAFVLIEDPALRTKTAVELFGRSGAKMLALLGDSSALSLAGETPEARRKIITQRVGVDSVAEMDTEISQLQESLRLGNYSGSGGEIERVKQLMEARRIVARVDRSIASQNLADSTRKNDEELRERNKAAGEKQKRVDEMRERVSSLQDENKLPTLRIWATASRAIGLGGNAVDNSKDIARIQADRQREANGLLKEIKEILKGGIGSPSPSEVVFS